MQGAVAYHYVFACNELAFQAITRRAYARMKYLTMLVLLREEMGAGDWAEGTDLLVDPNKIGNCLRLINDFTGIDKRPNVTMVEVRARAHAHTPHHAFALLPPDKRAAVLPHMWEVL